MGHAVKSELVVYNGVMHVDTRFTDTNIMFISASVEVADGFLHIVVDDYDNSLMLDADAIPHLIKALQKLQRQAKKI
jgi:hypothetical protein